MEIQDLKVGNWFVYENDDKRFSAVRIDEIKIKEGVTEKYAKIIGKNLLIREDYFGCDNTEYVFYESMLQHSKVAKCYTPKEFERLYDKYLKQEMKDILF